MARWSAASSALAACALLGAAVACAVTLTWDGAFPPAPGEAVNTVLAEGRGWSATTLALAVPAGLVGWRAARRGDRRGPLLVAGTMGYLTYTYLELATSPPFTALYLLYIATFATALPALIGAVAAVDLDTLPAVFVRAPRRVVAGFGFAFASVLSMAWLAGIVERTRAGAFGYPQGAEAVGHVVHALDLGLQVPLGVAAGVMLLRGDRGAWVVGALALTMAALMSPALVAMVGVSLVYQGEDLAGVAPFVALAAWSLGLAGVTWRAAAPSHG